MALKLKGINHIRKTKIVCTIGPSCSSPAVINKMIMAGMRVARINFSHGTNAEHISFINTVREEARKLNAPVAIMQDLPGPKDRTGKVKNGEVALKKGSNFILTTKSLLGDHTRVSINWLDLPRKVKKGDLLFLNDGNIKLKVVSTTATEITCEVMNGGKLGNNKGVNAPGINLIESVTTEDLKHVGFGIDHGVDFIAISFIKSANDVLTVRRFLDRAHYPCLLIAKIERREALDKLDEILEASDCAMVARGDLGVEIPLRENPHCPKNDH